MSADGTDAAGDDRPTGDDRPDGLDGADDLDAELRALFRDDARFAVRPRPHAPRHIVTGVRRRRRRRTALAGAGTTLAVVAAAGSVLVLRGAGLPDGPTEVQFAAPPATSEETTAAGSTASPPPDDPTPPTSRAHRDSAGPPSAASGGYTGTGLPPEQGGQVRGPLPRIRDDGYRALALGMPYRQAVATDMLRVTGEAPPPEGCASYPLVEGRDAVGLVTISPEHGVVSFEVTGAHTDQDVGIGTRERRLNAAYPDGHYATTPHSGEWGSEEPLPEKEYLVDRPGGAFHFAVRDETVVGMRLTALFSNC